jgi:hypothetical protein
MLHRSYYVDNFSVLVSSPNTYTYSSLFTYYYSLPHVWPHVGHLLGEKELQETHVTLTCVHIECSLCMYKIKYVFILMD